MAISPLKKPFLQQTSERRVQRNISGFRLRTGQRFPDIARGKLFEQDLQAEQIEKQQQARTALAFRQQEESQALEERKFAELQKQSQHQRNLQARAARRQKRADKEKKQEALNTALFGPFAPIANALT